MNTGIEVIIDGAVQIIKLNRPDVLNSFNRSMALALQAELDKARHDKNIRAVLITGNGKAFCAGQDLSEAIDASGPGIKNIVEEHYNTIITPMETVFRSRVVGNLREYVVQVLYLYFVDFPTGTCTWCYLYLSTP